MIKIKTIDNWENLSRLEKEWNKLLDCSGDRSIFLTFEWFSTFINSFEIKNLAITVAYKDNMLIGILPLYLDQINLSGLNFKVLRSISNVHSPKYNFIFKYGYEQYIVNSILLLKEKVNWDFLQIDFISDKTSLMNFSSEKSRSLYFQTVFLMRSPHILCNEDFNMFYNSLSKKFKKEMGYKLRRASKNYDIEYECINGKQLNSDILKEAFIIEDSGWKGRNNSSILKNPSFKKFYHDLAIKMNIKGWFDLNFLKFSSKRVAFRYCLKYNSVYNSLKTSYNETYRIYSPGMILTKITTENVFNAKYLKFDMLGQATESKLRISNGYDDIYRLFLFNKRTKSRISKFILFDFIGMLERLRLKTFMKAIYLKLKAPKIRNESRS